ncbi:aminoacyl-tRNA hydrolase [Patescibacteria group bacterium]|nr:aminoacyl-tRNA hydrolase [Patescibacteria group bacterium]
MKLIVGLGNPGMKYKKTRHNIGFLVVDEIASSLGVKIKKDTATKSEICETLIEGEKVILAKPQTFMNNSGSAVQILQAKFHIPNDNIWIISDDATIKFGKIRIRQSGSSGGHNGLKSIIEHIGENFVRIKIGVSEPPAEIPIEKWVLGKFNKEEKSILPEIVKNTAQKIIFNIKTKNISFETENLKK